MHKIRCKSLYLILKPTISKGQFQTTDEHLSVKLILNKLHSVLKKVTLKLISALQFKHLQSGIFDLECFAHDISLI